MTTRCGIAGRDCGRDREELVRDIGRNRIGDGTLRGDGASIVPRGAFRHRARDFTRVLPTIVDGMP
jgi:hypothetical protein